MSLESRTTYLWQWNTGQRLIVDYPVGTVVDFTANQADAIAREAYNEGGTIYVDIPNILLQSAGRLYIYVQCMEADHITTILDACFAIRGQPKPPDYISDEAEALTWHQLDERLSRLEEAGAGGPSDAVRYVPQELNPEQKEQARKNIGAASDHEDQPELIERIEISSGRKTVEKSAEPDGTPYHFKSVSVAVKIPVSADAAKELTVSLRWTNGDQDVFRFGPVGDPMQEKICSVYLACRDGVRQGSFSVRKDGITQSQTIEVIPTAAAISSICIEAGGKGLENKSSIEIRAVREEKM